MSKAVREFADVTVKLGNGFFQFIHEVQYSMSSRSLQNM